MNGRMYDPMQGRFLSPDNHIQDPFNTQNFNRFGYGFNNPLNGTDVSGEIFGSILIGALIGIITNGINNSINGEGFFKGWGKAALIGGISGAAAFGIGEAALGIKGTFLSTGIGTISNAAVFQFVAHGYLGGFMSAAQGGKFGAGFLSGGFGSAFGGKMGKWLQNARDFPKFIGTTVAGGISGGVGSRIAGGKFWNGFRNGAISAGLNHAAHKIAQETRPDWSKLSDENKVIEILKSLREAKLNDEFFIDMRKIFKNFPKHQISVGAKSLYSNIKINGESVEVYLDIARIQDMRISVDPGRYSQVYPSRGGTWDQLEYNFYRESNAFSGHQARAMTIQVQNNNYNNLMNYIRPKR